MCANVRVQCTALGEEGEDESDIEGEPAGIPKEGVFTPLSHHSKLCIQTNHHNNMFGVRFIPGTCDR